MSPEGVAARLEKRVDRLEDGLFVRLDVYDAQQRSIRSDLEELKDHTRWLMRTMVGLFLGILVQATVLVLQMASTQ